MSHIKVIIGLLSSMVILTHATDYYHLKPMQITDSLYCVVGDNTGPNKTNLGFSSNVCFVDMGKNVLVMDAGPTYQFAKELDTLIQNTIHLPVKYVVLSNYHDDRIQGASYFSKKDVEIIGHTSINTDIDSHPEKYERIIKVVSKEVYKDTTIVKANKTFENNLTIIGTKHSVELIKASSSSQAPSDILILVPDLKFIFAGNIVFNERLLSYAKNSNMKGWLEAIDVIEKLKPTFVIGGHGKNHDSKSYETTKGYLTSMKMQVEKQYDNDVELGEITKVVDLKKYNNLLNFDALNGKNIYNYYMQLEFSEE